MTRTEGFQLDIRPVTKEDLDDVVRITEAIIQRPVAPGWTNMVRMQLSKPEGIALAAEHEGEVIGFIFGDVKHGDFGLEHSGWIEMFGVAPKYMGMGVGRSLAEAVFQRFREQKIEDIYTAANWDSGDLLAFFKQLGFSLSDHIVLKTRID
jgi:GNAT superfamily N-acetyltransferase